MVGEIDLFELNRKVERLWMDYPASVKYQPFLTPENSKKITPYEEKIPGIITDSRTGEVVKVNLIKYVENPEERKYQRHIIDDKNCSN